MVQWVAKEVAFEPHDFNAYMPCLACHEVLCNLLHRSKNQPQPYKKVNLHFQKLGLHGYM